MNAAIDRRTLIAALAATAALPSSLAFAEPRTVTGSALYRERIALPPDAVLTVRLGVLAGNALGSQLIAEQIVAPAGQVPIPFSLSFDTQDAPQDARLGLDATITAAGATLFRTAQAIPLPAGDAAVEIMLASAREPAAKPAPITGVEWQVEHIEGVDNLGETRPTLTIGADGRAGGSTGCNRFFAKATIDGEVLAFSEAGTTFMACDETVMRVERAFLDALAAVAAYRLEDGMLVLVDAEGVARMKLTSAA
ncbi:MAG: META domain-containing protein [Rhizobiaceae bacterium]|nr:META domain-containing protein [Rhizobiaceae bacterium]